MNFLFNLFLNFFTTVLEKIGILAISAPCIFYYDEPEVPEELTELYK